MTAATIIGMLNIRYGLHIDSCNCSTTIVNYIPDNVHLKQIIAYNYSYLFMYFIIKIIHVWNGHGVDSEIETCLPGKPRWTAKDKCWNKKFVSRGSVVASVERLPICVRNSWALTLMGPSVSRATGKKSWVPLRELYFVVFLTAAVSAALVMALCWTYFSEQSTMQHTHHLRWTTRHNGSSTDSADRPGRNWLKPAKELKQTV